MSKKKYDPVDAWASAEKWKDKAEGLQCDLDSALDIIWRRGDEEARIWLFLNYNKEARKFAIELKPYPGCNYAVEKTSQPNRATEEEA